MTVPELILVGLVMLTGFIGVVVPVLPGLMLMVAGALWWAVRDGGGPGHWAAFAVIAVIALVGTVLKYGVAARTTSQTGTPNISMAFAVVLGVAGFFLIPVAGAPLGFVVGVYLAERKRLGGHREAWIATVAALKGVLLGMLLEFTAAVLIFTTWIVAVLAT